MEATPTAVGAEHDERSQANEWHVVSGRADVGEPLSQGLRVVRELLNGSNSVLFSILPRGLLFHAAAGNDSARLAQQLVHQAEALHELVQGPCILGAPVPANGESQVTVLPHSPVAESWILAERAHRDTAFGLALMRLRPHEHVAPARLRFAHTVFRDLAQMVRRRAAEAAPPRKLDERWQRYRFAGLVGGSRVMRTLFRTIEKLAASDVNVLLLGESGTGKELVARAVHDSDLYAGRRFVAQNCAALPEALLESELFGHCKGAFTGANFEKKGLFEEAHGGTFFLDEIADMPLPLQIKMLRVLQDGEIRRLGETRTRLVQARIVAATNKNLAQEVAHGRFRQDLFYRLNVVRLELPPLRRRREDIALLARFFCDKVCARLGREALRFSDAALSRLVEYDWPGNVRELENEMERLVALHGDASEIQPYMLSERLRYGSSVDWSLERLEEIHNLHRATEYLERAMIARSLERHAWNKSRSAVELGVSRQGLIKKIKRLQLLRSDAATPEQEGHRAACQLQLPFAEEWSNPVPRAEVCAFAAD
jgi:DNA-binding NtrC family response regulator